MPRILLTDAPDARPTSSFDTINTITTQLMLPVIQRSFEASRRWTTELKIAALRKSCGVDDQRRCTGPSITEHFAFKVPTP